MSPRVRAALDVIKELNLSEDERHELGSELAGDTPEEWHPSWNDELSRRMAQIENGEVELVDGDEVLADLRTEFSS